MKIQEAPTGRSTPGISNTAPSLPIVAVAGTRGKSTVSWLLHQILVEAGFSVGLWATSGVFMNGRHLVGELGPWSEVVTALSRGELDVAVQELENSVVTGVGLPKHTYPLAAISALCGNNDECLISSEAAQGAVAQDIVARAVRPDGTIVLNADDQAVLTAADETDASVTLFALHPENPSLRRHREAGGTAVWIDEHRIVIRSNGTEERVIDIREAGFTLGNALTFQVQNLLCAVALAWHMGVDLSAVREAVRTFQPDIELMPGSCNIIDYNGATVLLDSARQVWTVRSLIRGIRAPEFHRTVVVSDCFCHLNHDQVHEAGRLLGRAADVVVTHRRNTDSDGVDRFKDGLAHNDVPPLVFAMPTEADAIAHALKMLDPGSLCLLLTSNVQDAIALIRRNQ
jgi:cyanophycin synthetase